MPYSIQWHASKKILIITYQGELTNREYRQLRKERANAIDAGPPAAVLCANMQEFDAFPDASPPRDRDNILLHPAVRGLVIVLAPADYRQWTRAIVEDYAVQLPIHFVPSLDEALRAAEAMLA